MSLAAKATFIGSCAATTFVIWGVYKLQVLEGDNMYRGVLRDDARRQAKKAERERELDEQARLRAYLESEQPVSNPTSPIPPLVPGSKPLTKDELQLGGCKTC